MLIVGGKSREDEVHDMRGYTSFDRHNLRMLTTNNILASDEILLLYVIFPKAQVCLLTHYIK